MSPFDAPPEGSDSAGPDWPEDRLAQVMAGLIRDCQEVGTALLLRDWTQALSRTRGIHHAARLAALTDIEEWAASLDHAILAAAEGRPAAIGWAFDQLSRARSAPRCALSAARSGATRPCRCGATIGREKAHQTIHGAQDRTVIDEALCLPTGDQAGAQ